MEPRSASNSGAVRAPVAVTGLGAVSALGFGAGAIWRALAEGRDGIRPIERFSTEGFSVHTAGMVPLPAAGPARETADHALDFAVAAAREAVASARLGAAGAPAPRVAIAFGTSLATHPEGIHRLAEITAERVGAAGPRVTVSTACASSANAIGVARDLLLEGVADVVIAGGSDALTEEIFAGFHNLGLLTPGKCAPFSEPPGTTLGEGAGFLVLERAEHAAARGAAPIAWVSGHGLSCDAYHATSPDPTGSGIARAARAALADAGLSPADVDYVNAHGTGTEANDPAEWRGLCHVLGERAAAVPVSATKSVFGHGQGAAGVLEIIATLLAMQHGAIPQTLHHTRARPRCPADPVAQPTPRAHRVAHALCDSSAFGGANSIVTIDASASPAPGRSVRRRAIRLLGAGLSLPGIADVAALASLGESAAPRGRLAQGPAPRSLAGVDLRGFDPGSRLLTFATAEALRDARVALRGALRDRAGLFVALTRISPASAHELDDSVKERGLLRLSAPAFTRVVLNAGPGACARALQLRGPTTTLTTGDGGGLTALVLACDHLALRDDADLLCAAAADEIDPEEPPERLCEAGACLVLGAGDASAASGPSVRVAGWGLAGPGEKDLAIARACALAGLDPERAPAQGDSAPPLPAPAAHPLLRAAVIAHRLRAQGRGSALLAHANGSCAAAVIFDVSPGQER
jgi:3-oxoacyl-[acyl-carrier-protein] synthase II